MPYVILALPFALAAFLAWFGMKWIEAGSVARAAERQDEVDQ